MPAKFQVDGSERRCGGGCNSTFRITDYPPGYFMYKKDVKRGSRANTCPSCELVILKNYLQAEEGKIGEKSIQKTKDDIKLLQTGKPANETHIKNIKRVYGPEAGLFSQSHSA